MKTPTYKFGYFYIILIRLFAALTLIAAASLAMYYWHAASHKIRSLTYVAPTSFIERYNNLASLMRMNYEFVMMLNNQAPIPDAHVDAKRYLAPLAQDTWTQEDFSRFNENLQQAGAANRALKEYLMADYCRTVSSFAADLSERLSEAKRQIIPPLPPPGSAAQATPAPPQSRAKPRDFPTAPFLQHSANLRESTETIRQAEDMIIGLQKTFRGDPGAGFKDVNTEALERAQDYISMFRQLLGISIARITEEEAVAARPTTGAVTGPDAQYQVAYMEYREKLRQLGRIEQIVADVHRVLIQNVKGLMTNEWPTDGLIPGLLEEIEAQEQEIVRLESTKTEISARRWVECGRPLAIGILIAFVLFVSADFLGALLDTAKHTGLVAEAIQQNQETGG